VALGLPIAAVIANGKIAAGYFPCVLRTSVMTAIQIPAYPMSSRSAGLVSALACRAVPSEARKQ